jgi:hypothetical protein
MVYTDPNKDKIDVEHEADLLSIYNFAHLSEQKLIKLTLVSITEEMI